MSRLLRPVAALAVGLALDLGLGAAPAPPPRPAVGPYFDYITHAPELQPVRPISGLRRWDTWLYMPWRYRWGIGTGEAGGRFCREHAIHGGVSDHAQGPFPWLERFRLRFYNDHTAGKGDLHLEEDGFIRLARDAKAIRPRPLDGELLAKLQKLLGERVGTVRKSPLRVAYALGDETSPGKGEDLFRPAEAREGTGLVRLQPGQDGLCEPDELIQAAFPPQEQEKAA